MIYNFNLNPSPFSMMQSGRKTIELRLCDEKRRDIKFGDIIVFTNNKNEKEKLVTRVRAVHRFENFTELYNTLPLLKCGYTEDDIGTADASDMNEYYSPEKQAKYGVLGIEIELCELRLRLARADEVERVLSLYKSAIGKEFCAWDDEYPSMTEISHDLETDNLYVLDAGGVLAGAISVVPENELDGFDEWEIKDGTEREIARITVLENFRGMRLAGRMVNEMLEILKARGVGAVHLSAAKQNIPAHKTYLQLGFNIVREAKLYGGEYYLLEKIL